MKRYARRELVAPRRTVSFEYVDHATGEYIEETLEGTYRPAEDRFLACGARSVNESGAVGMKYDGAKAGFSGLSSCGSAWACTVCGAKIQQQRAADLTGVTAWARREKKTVALVTFTIRHKKRDELTAVWDAVAAGWGAVTAGKSWVSETVEKFTPRLERWEAALELARDGQGRMPRNGRAYLAALALEESGVMVGLPSAGFKPARRIGDQERYALMGWARAAEATHSSANGWHVHLHVLMVLDGGRHEAEANAHALGAAMWDRYAAGIATVTDSAGDPFTALRFKADGSPLAIDVRVSVAAEKRLAEYLAKDGLVDSPEKVRASVEKAGRKAAMETAQGAGKLGRGAGRTPFQILDAINVESPGADLAVWREWVVGSMGRRQLTTSAGWRELANLPAELTDEEAAAQEPGGTMVLNMPSATWTAVPKSARLALVEMMERAGVDAVLDHLTGLGLEVDDLRERDELRQRATANTGRFAEAFGAFQSGCWTGPTSDK